jgi:hypothetical protein
MTGGDDNVFARWSRRKLATRLDEAPASHEAEPASTEIAAADDAPVPEPDPSDTEVEELDADLAESLPRVEDLTAESDITAFLKKGVPMALKSAALRRVWSLDPAIRDYIGPSEYAWDFNQPGSMAGFGPLDVKEAVVGFLSKAARVIDTVTEPSEATQAAGPLHEQPADALPDAAPPTKDPEASPTETLPQDEPSAVPATLVVGTNASPPVEGGVRPDSPDGGYSSRLAEPVARPRHGGAMPR